MSARRSAPSSSSASAPDKRRKLAKLIGLRGVTTQALAQILAVAHEEQIEPLSRWQIDSFVRHEFARVRFTIKLPLQEGGEFDWDVCRPDLMLKYFADEYPAFRDAVTKAVTSAGARPLGAILYLDEVVPGNLLRPDNRRKIWAIYMAFAEFGPELLFQEQFWLPIAVIRSSVAAGIKGGISQCVRSLVRAFLLDPCNMATGGFAMRLGSPTLVRLQVSHLIADESALKSVWNSKGASGIKPCFFCSNVVSMASELASAEPHLVDVSCIDPKRFQLLTDNDVWSSFEKLRSESARLSKREFATLERASGLNFDANSILADRDLRPHMKPITATVMDWMHNFLVNGIFSVEAHAFLARCKEVLGIHYAEMHRFVTANWRWPSWQAAHKVS